MFEVANSCLSRKIASTIVETKGYLDVVRGGLEVTEGLNLVGWAHVFYLLSKQKTDMLRGGARNPLWRKIFADLFNTVNQIGLNYLLPPFSITKWEKRKTRSNFENSDKRGLHLGAFSLNLLFLSYGDWKLSIFHVSHPSSISEFQTICDFNVELILFVHSAESFDSYREWISSSGCSISSMHIFCWESIA